MKGTRNKKERFSLNQVVITAFFFMMFGTVLELYLLDHYEDAFQFIPLVCILLSFVCMVVLLFNKSTVIITIFKVLMATTALSGVYGIYLHLGVNFEFEQEMTPSFSNWDLIVESLSGAVPSLAPGSLIVVALIGYSYIKLIKSKQ